MKILHIYDEHAQVLPGQGSVPTVIFYIAKFAAKKGHDVSVLERRWKGSDSKEVIEGIKFERINLKIGSNIPWEEVPYNEIKKPFSLLRLILDRTHFALKANKYLKKNNIDVIHVHLPFVANILINLNRDLRKKMVYTAHIGEETKRFNLASGSPLALRFFSPDLYLMRRVRKSVVLNEPLKRKLALKGIREDSLEVIPNGVEVDDYRGFNEDEIKRVKEKYGVTDGTTVMFAGTITPRKGVETLMKATEMVINQQSRRDVLFLLVGNLSIDKDFAEKTKEHVRNRSLESNVKFTGFVSYEDLKALYAVCDIFVLPSFEEGDPIALKEALASGKPLIASDVGGIPMQIRDGWNGFLMEPGNEKQLAEKIEYLIENEGERIRMGKNSRKLAEEKFDWKKIAERYLKVYEEIKLA